MESLTKYRQSRETIEKMVGKIFPGQMLTDYIELTEGYFNVAYEICLNGNQNVILKIAPEKDMRIMSYEKDIMKSEVWAMKEAELVEGVLVPRVLGEDFSCSICSSPYFFMEKLEGKSLNSIKETLTDEKLEEIYFEMGKMNRQIHTVTCPCFGYPAQPQLQGNNWFCVFKQMLDMGVQDAKNGNVDLKISEEVLWDCLEKDREIFEEVKHPVLIHWDCWDGNIFVLDGKITGLIDWERCLWGDPLLEVGFRTYENNGSFYRGYGITEWTKPQRRRALWYDIYLMILVSLECEYRKYDSLDLYEWSTTLLVEQMKKIQEGGD